MLGPLFALGLAVLLIAVPMFILDVAERIYKNK